MYSGLGDLSPEQIAEIKRLFIQVRETPEHERSSMLAGCDEVTRAAVAHLLGVFDHGEKILSDPAIAAVHDDEILPCGFLVADRYALESPAGHGGFGTVYRARDTHLQERVVAVKILFSGVTACLVHNREISALTVTDNPHIAAILDAGELPDGRLFMVTQWIEGRTLAELSAEIDDRSLERMAEDIADALDHCRSVGVVHLDIRPENIMCRSATGRWVLVDFGVSLLETAGEEAWRSRRSVWSAPDLDSAHVGIEADYYSLGAILSHVRGTDSHWQPLIRQLMVEDPAHRLATRSGVERRLPSRFQGRMRRNIAAGAAAAVLCLAVPLWTWRTPAHETMPAPVPLTTYPGEEVTPFLSPDGSRVWFVWNTADRSSDLYELRIGDSAPRRLTFDGAAKSFPAVSPDGRQLAFVRHRGAGINQVWLLSLADRAQRQVFQGMVHSLTWTPDGSAIIVAHRDFGDTPRELVRIDVASGALDPVASPEAGFSLIWPAYSPDGRWLAYCRRRGPAAQELCLRAAKASGAVSGPEILITTDGRDLISPAWTPDSRHILFLDGSPTARRVWAVPAREGAQRWLLLPGEQDLDRITTAASSWRAVLARSRLSSNIYEFSNRTKRTRTVVQSSSTDEEVAVSPDGDLLAFITNRSGEEEVWLAEPRTSRERPIFTGSRLVSISVFWMRSDELLVQGYRQGARELWFARTNGPASQWNNAPDGHVVGASSDGRFLYVRRSTGLWRVAPDGKDSLHLSAKLPATASGSPDGAVVYFNPVQSNEVWQVNTANPLRDVKTPIHVSRHAFDVSAAGVFASTDEPTCVLRFFPFGASTPEVLWRSEQRCWFGFAALTDGSAVYLSGLDSDGIDLVLLDDFRL